MSYNLKELTEQSSDLLNGDRLIAFEKEFKQAIGSSKVRVYSYVKNNKLILECTNEHTLNLKDKEDLTIDQMEHISRQMLNVKNFFQKINSWTKETKYSDVTERLVTNLNKEFKR